MTENTSNHKEPPFFVKPKYVFFSFLVFTSNRRSLRLCRFTPTRGHTEGVHSLRPEESGALSLYVHTNRRFPPRPGTEARENSFTITARLCWDSTPSSRPLEGFRGYQLDYGVTDIFIAIFFVSGLASSLPPGSSSLLLPVRRADSSHNRWQR